MDKFESLVNEALEDVKSFKGWDFSHLTGSSRMMDVPIKWDYIGKVKSYLNGINTMLDIGTAGGEVLSQLRPLPEKTYAVEDYTPNVILAKNKLEPLGVAVIGIEEGKEPPFGNLPFEDDYFDLVINRHTGCTLKEINRILKPGGFYVTQQVGGLTTLNLALILRGEQATHISNWNLKVMKEHLVESGFEITDEEDEISFTRFSDIGAIVYHLIACPWTIEDFTVEKYRSQLFYLHEYIERNGYFDMLFEWLFTAARKPLHRSRI